MQPCACHEKLVRALEPLLPVLAPLLLALAPLLLIRELLLLVLAPPSARKNATVA